MKRVEILKTYKIYIDGKFPRTESGRYYTPKSGKTPLGNICLSSRKDFRNAVVAARGAFDGWSTRSGFNRSQILYRIGEMLEGRKAQFVEELRKQGATEQAAIREVEASIDRLIYFSGWCDKYPQLFSSVNPVSAPYFNFSAPESMGVVAVLAPEDSSLLGLVTAIAPVIAGGNTAVVLASESKPLCAVTFAEVLHSSDVPGGVVNILTGNRKELNAHFASHMDVNAIYAFNTEGKELAEIQLKAVENLKRVFVKNSKDWFSSEHDSPYSIMDFQETKTTWHPIEVTGSAGGAY
jgi:acyl-CoA reductase-like NAD-dependent aldehyde dehydrogenase